MDWQDVAAEIFKVHNLKDGEGKNNRNEYRKEDSSCEGADKNNQARDPIAGFGQGRSAENVTFIYEFIIHYVEQCDKRNAEQRSKNVAFYVT